MGRFYSNITINITIKGQQQDIVLNYLKQLNKRAYVSPTVDDFTVVFDEESESDLKQLSNLAAEISQKFGCPVFAINVYDESCLYYELYDKGDVLDEYISDVSFLNPKLGSFPKGGDAQKLCTTLGVKEATNLVRPILREPTTDKTYVFASKRHRNLAQKLSIPKWSTDAIGGYSDIEEEEIDAVIFDEDDFPDLEATLSLLKKTFT